MYNAPHFIPGTYTCIHWQAFLHTQQVCSDLDNTHNVKATELRDEVRRMCRDKPYEMKILGWKADDNDMTTVATAAEVYIRYVFKDPLR